MKTDLEISQLINPYDVKHISLEYLLTHNKSENNLDSFGIQVIKTTLRNENKEIETSRVDDISCSRECTEHIIDIIARNNVTPVTLKDVVEDLIS